MGARRRRADWALRAPMRSPGRPPVVRREERQRFWAAIAGGLSSEDAAAVAGVSSAVGTRWFRNSGGMPWRYETRAAMFPSLRVRLEGK